MRLSDKPGLCAIKDQKAFFIFHALSLSLSLSLSTPRENAGSPSCFEEGDRKKDMSQKILRADRRCSHAWRGRSRHTTTGHRGRSSGCSVASGYLLSNRKERWLRRVVLTSSTPYYSCHCTDMGTSLGKDEFWTDTGQWTIWPRVRGHYDFLTVKTLLRPKCHPIVFQHQYTNHIFLTKEATIMTVRHAFLQSHSRICFVFSE